MAKVNLLNTVSNSKRTELRALRFCIVGGVGALIQLGLTYFLTETVGLYYMTGITVAILVATLWNFVLHGFWTYRVFQPKGRRSGRALEGDSSVGLYL